MPAGRGTILVVEDDYDIRGALGAVLGDEGWPHHLVSCPDQAVEALRYRRAPALILTDLFPGPDGDPRPALRRIRAAAPDVPLVVMTGAMQTIERVRRDATEVLTKPFTADAVLSLVLRLCGPG